MVDTPPGGVEIEPSRVMTDSPFPPVGRGPHDRARLARALADARRDAGVSGMEAGRRAGMSQSKVSKIERGFLLPTVDDVRQLCMAYEMDKRATAELAGLAAGLREEASARVIMARGVAEIQRRVGQLEASSQIMRTFQPTMVIGLLQTPAYARCVFSSSADVDDVDDAVAARLARQPALRDQSKQFRLVMTEGALRWQAGSAALMAEQVEAIAECTKLPNVAVGLIPWVTPVRLFPRHGFHLYDDAAVIVGTETATATMTGQADIETYAELFDALERLASFGDQCREHLTRIANEYRQLAV